MFRCVKCGAPTKPWFELCYQCYNPTSRMNVMPEPIAAKDFMKNMRIDGWK